MTLTYRIAFTDPDRGFVARHHKEEDVEVDDVKRVEVMNLPTAPDMPLDLKVLFLNGDEQVIRNVYDYDLDGDEDA